MKGTPTTLLPISVTSNPVRTHKETAATLLSELMASSLVPAEDWDGLTAEAQEEVCRSSDAQSMLDLLVRFGLLTRYQADRVKAGKTFGLVLGNYRVLDRLGAGAMGVVFKAEHRDMRRQVAVKVLPLSDDQDSRLLQRFLAEIRIVARLQHPNIVAAMDAGKCPTPDPTSPTLHYFVMEFVPGQDLEELVRANGVLCPAEACDLAHQVAAALSEAHKHNLVHRDIKPSNVRVTPDGQAKLLDFGLARHNCSHLTQPGTLLGTLDYMAPEQCCDATGVDIRADIYGLGGTLFWCLTGQAPFASRENIHQQLNRRLTQPPPSVRALRPDIRPELDAVLARMMATDPEDRYPTPEAVMRALLPFLKPLQRDLPLSAGSATGEPNGQPPGRADPAGVQQILVVDDEPEIRRFCHLVLQSEGVHCDEAVNGSAALEAVRAKPYDLVLLDNNMPGLNGMDVCRKLRETPPSPNLKIVIFSGRVSPDEMPRLLAAGADDYLPKPVSPLQLQSRIKILLRLKTAQDRGELLKRQLLAASREREEAFASRDSVLRHARDAMALAMANLVQVRDGQSGSHPVRLSRYCRCLAEEATSSPAFAGQIDPAFIEMLECCAPLHDVGKVGLPDHILLKAGKLEPDERLLMQTHTVIGAEALQAVARQHGSALEFLQMAADVARHHHERYDGQGYPDRLAGDDIPLAARLVAIGDTYDALRSRRTYKPALSHSSAVQVILQFCEGQFDPALLQVFQQCAHRFERIFKELPG